MSKKSGEESVKHGVKELRWELYRMCIAMSRDRWKSDVCSGIDFKYHFCMLTFLELCLSRDRVLLVSVGPRFK